MPSKAIFGADAAWIKSEALMTLDIGPGRLPAMLVMGAEEPAHVPPQARAPTCSPSSRASSNGR